MTYALVRPDNTVDRKASNIDPNTGTKPGWRWLPVHLVNPSFDPATQVKQGPVDAVEASRVVETYTVREKTAAELDADKDARVSAADRIIGAALWDAINEIRALKVPPQPALTKAQYLNYLKTKIGAL